MNRASGLFIALAAISVAILMMNSAHAQVRWPEFPPSVDEWHMNVTYNHGLSERITENLRGSVHYAKDRVAVHAVDALRSSEIVLFRFDKVQRSS